MMCVCFVLSVSVRVTGGLRYGVSVHVCSASLCVCVCCVAVQWWTWSPSSDSCLCCGCSSVLSPPHLSPKHIISHCWITYTPHAEGVITYISWHIPRPTTISLHHHPPPLPSTSCTPCTTPPPLKHLKTPSLPAQACLHRSECVFFLPPRQSFKCLFNRLMVALPFKGLIAIAYHLQYMCIASVQEWGARQRVRPGISLTRGKKQHCFSERVIP